MEQLRTALETALETGDLASVEPLLAEDCVFWSPALHRPYAGRAVTLLFLRAAAQSFQSFRYVRTFTEDDGRGHVLMFTAEVDGRSLEGADLVTLNDDGLVSEFRVMVRPLTGLQALMGQMAPRMQAALAESGLS